MQPFNLWLGPNAELYGIGVCLPDAQGHLAFHCARSKPHSRICTYLKHWYVPILSPFHHSEKATGLACYLLFWLFQFPIMLLSPQKIRYLFTAKAAIVPLTWLVMLIWAMKKAPPSVSLQADHSPLSGSALSWAWLSSMNNAFAIYSTLSVNIPDFTVILKGFLSLSKFKYECFFSDTQRPNRRRSKLASSGQSMLKQFWQSICSDVDNPRCFYPRRVYGYADTWHFI